MDLNATKYSPATQNIQMIQNSKAKQPAKAERKYRAELAAKCSDSIIDDIKRLKNL